MQFLIRDFIYLKEDNWSLKYLLEEIRNTLLVGSLLIFIITSLNIERLKKIYIKKSKDLGTSLKFHDTNTKEKVLIKTQVLSDDFILDVDDFLYAKSDKNYVELFMKDDAVLLKRMTIKSFEEQILSYSNICRVHRSYIINLKTIKKIEGNSQGFQLWINDIDFIPVSRNMISSFERAFKAIKN
ncbi:LytTR family transcriptional regulator DNA-binding domain-containing protein [uncultured Tenacibaculum sp.]|uniref:LytR/AlgR family response regulator transcription factor n=1 Tax=uncultured Tenacibaculum sp. TaxID=174713 RepID=UPI002606C1F6|nr:LytTR family transcriptional regulator DNA-binding domain-containing protein [uncultured Tenacibaculum sp.]